MDYEAVNVSISEQLTYETNRKSTVIIIDNSKGLYDLIEERVKDLKFNNGMGKAQKGIAIASGVAFVIGLINPVTAVGELIFLGAAGAGMGLSSKHFSKKGFKNYSLLSLDEEKKEIVLVHKEYDKKKDTYHKKGETVIASENEVEEQNNPAEEKGE